MTRLPPLLAAFVLVFVSYLPAAVAQPMTGAFDTTNANYTAPIQSAVGIDSIEAERQERTRPHFTRRTKVGLSGGFDYLTDSMEAWNSVTANFSSRLLPGRTVYGYLRQQERFGYRDFEGLVGMYYKLDPRWMLVGEVKASPTHNVVPRYMGFLQAEYGFGNGWRAGLGGRYSVYGKKSEPTKPVTVGTLMVEKYFSDFRAAYNLFTSNLNDTVGLRLSHLVQLGYYYGGFKEEVSSINVGVSFGVESAEFVDPNMFGVDLKSIFLRGDHWFAPRWALTYGLRTNSQKHYSRYGIDLGLDFRLGTDH